MADVMTEKQDNALPLPEGLEEQVLASITETYASICGNSPEIETCSPDLWKQEAVVSIISLVGEVPLTMLLHFPRDTSVKFSEVFSGMEFDFHSNDMNDLIGELANIIAGDTKARLETIGVNSALSLPTVVKGSHVQIAFRDQVLIGEVNYKSVEGNFQVRLATARQSNMFGTSMPGGDAG